MLLRHSYNLLPIGLVTVLTLVWASRPTVPVLVRGMGSLTPPESRRGFYARGPGEVQTLLVKVGQTVASGQRLLTLSRVGQNTAEPRQARPGESPQVTTARLAAVAQQLQTLTLQDRALNDQRRSLEQRRHQIETTNRPVGDQLKALESLRKDQVIARYSPLWVGAQDLWLRNRADISAVDAGLAQLQAQRAGLRAQAAELQAQRAVLRSEERAQEVFSPAAGKVLEISVLPGQPVLPGQKLGSLSTPPRHAGRLAVVLFTAADASRLAVGDEVRLNPQLLSRDSFGGSEQRYGLVPGQVVRLSMQSVDLEEVALELGSREEAANLMASARQRSFGDGGDLTSQLPGRTGAPLVLGVVRLKEAPTPSGLAWTRSRGPGHALPQRTPAEVEAEVERRSVLSYLQPFGRWLSGARS